MSYSEFEQLVRAYGARVENWPDTHRAAMQACAGPEANALMAREARLDGWLDARLPDAPTALTEALLSQIPDTLPAIDEATADTLVYVPLTISRRAYGNALAALAACFIFGFVVGPILIDTLSADGIMFASLDILSTSFLPTEPL